MSSCMCHVTAAPEFGIQLFIVNMQLLYVYTSYLDCGFMAYDMVKYYESTFICYTQDK